MKKQQPPTRNILQQAPTNLIFFLWFLAQMFLPFFSQIAANTYLKMIWKKRKQQPPTLKHTLAITIQGFFFCFIFKEVIAARQDWMHLRSKKIFITEMIQDYCHVKCHYHHKYRSWGEAEKQRKLFYSKNRSLG